VTIIDQSIESILPIHSAISKYQYKLESHAFPPGEAFVDFQAPETCVRALPQGGIGRDRACISCGRLFNLGHMVGNRYWASIEKHAT
jgi:hypothetical protein